MILVITYWHGSMAYCEMCSHYHDGECLCADCGQRVSDCVYKGRHDAWPRRPDRGCQRLAASG